MVLAFTLCVSLVAGLLFGLIPVFKYARPQFSNGLRSGGRSLTGSKERHRARSLLVVVQVALAVVLLVGSGLMIRTFRALRHVDPGFSGRQSWRRCTLEFQRRRSKIRSGSFGWKRISSGRSSPFRVFPRCGIERPSHRRRLRTIRFMRRTTAIAKAAFPPVRRFKYVSPGYFSTIGSHLIAGRDLTWNELYNRTPVAVVSENLAHELWHDPRAAIGKRIRVPPKDDWREVIGVVADLRDDGIDQKSPAIVYWPLLQKNFECPRHRDSQCDLRHPHAEGGIGGVAPGIQKAVATVNASLPVADVKTLQSVYASSLARSSLTLVLLAIAGGMALLLGVVGIYGVISYSVSQRTREIGIRLALGAQFQEVTRLFVRQGLVMSGIGVICGLPAALALTGLMRSLLFEVSPADPVTYVAASAGLILAALLGSYLPARKAIKIDPVNALRAE